MYYRIKKAGMKDFEEVEYEIDELDDFVVEDFASEFDLNKGDIIEFREKKNSKIIKYQIRWVHSIPEYFIERIK